LVSTLYPEKDRNVSCNIFHKTRAILLKFDFIIIIIIIIIIIKFISDKSPQLHYKNNRKKRTKNMKQIITKHTDIQIPE